jgi:hypothetical protein
MKERIGNLRRSVIWCAAALGALTLAAEVAQAAGSEDALPIWCGSAMPTCKAALHTSPRRFSKETVSSSMWATTKGIF